MAARLEAMAMRAAAWVGAGGRWRLAALLALALAAFAPGQGALPPSDRDEARFAQATKQMLETGDFVDIRFQDEPRHKKPVGIYWLQAASAALAGGAEAPIWAYRAPSFLGAAAAAALTAWALAPLVGWRAGALAAAMLGAAALLHVEARIAKTDAALLATVVVAMGCLARALARPAADAGRFGGALLGFWAAVGVGVLLKGPIVALPPLGALGWLAVAGRSLAPFRAIRPLPGLGVVALIAAPWLVAITMLSDGGFWAESVGRDMLGKVAAGQEAHWGPPGYHLGVFWGVFWPFAALAPFAALWLWPRRRKAPWPFLLGWIAPVWLVFELAPTKLPHYVLITYPAIAAVIAAAVLDARAAAPRWARRAALVLWAIPAAALPAAAALAGPVIEGRMVWGAALLAVPAAALLWGAGRALADWRLRPFALRTGVGAALVYAAIFGFALPSLDRAFLSPRLAAAVAEHRCGREGRVALGEYTEPSAVFLLGTDTALVGGAEAARMLVEGEAALAFIGAREMAAFTDSAAALGLEPAVLGTYAGFNYSRGREVRLTLVADAAAPGGCAG